MPSILISCIKSIAGINRGFSPEISKRLDDAGYRLADDPEGFFSPVDNPRAHNPNYTVGDTGKDVDHPEDYQKLAQKSRGMTPAESGIGQIVSMPSFMVSGHPGLAKKIAKKARKGGKQKPKSEKRGPSDKTKKGDKKKDQKKSAKNEQTESGLTEGAKGAFKKLVGKLAHKKGKKVRDPRALAAWIERRKGLIK